jgi:hypothetical protein
MNPNLLIFRSSVEHSVFALKNNLQNRTFVLAIFVALVHYQVCQSFSRASTVMRPAEKVSFDGVFLEVRG